MAMANDVLHRWPRAAPHKGGVKEYPTRVKGSVVCLDDTRGDIDVFQFRSSALNIPSLLLRNVEGFEKGRIVLPRCVEGANSLDDGITLKVNDEVVARSDVTRPVDRHCLWKIPPRLKFSF
jgi:hypothetical protein